MRMTARTSVGAEFARRWQACGRPLAVGACALLLGACFGSGGDAGGASGSGGTTAGAAAGISGGGTTGTTTAGAPGGGGTGTATGGMSGGSTGGAMAGTSGGGTSGGSPGTCRVDSDCPQGFQGCDVCDDGHTYCQGAQQCRDGTCVSASGEPCASGGKDAGMPDPNLLLECLNTLFETEAACVDACEPCCIEAGDDHGMCAPASPGPYRCTCWSDPTPRGCQATGCPDGQQCCDGGIPCLPVCVPIGMGCGCDRDCDSPDTPIATPDGERPVAELREGDLVLSVQGGVVVAVPVVATRRHAVAAAHAVVRVVLSSGRTIEISASHPTADGRTLGVLVPGDRLGDARIDAVSMVPYAHEFTYDILPASDTGSYFAAGALVGSTLARDVNSAMR